MGGCDHRRLESAIAELSAPTQRSYSALLLGLKRGSGKKLHPKKTDGAFPRLINFAWTYRLLVLLLSIAPRDGTFAKLDKNASKLRTIYL